MNNKNKLESKLINNIEDIIKDLSANQLNAIGNHILQLSKNKTPSLSSPSQLTILYGSQTGNSRSIAEELYEEMKNHNIQSSLQSMGKFREKEIKQIQNLLVIVSTQGEGDPPDDALNLVEYLNSNKAPKLNSMNFGVLGLGDTSYEHFCKTGKDFDAKLEQLGATRILERVDLDVDFEEDSNKWISSAISTLEPLVKNEVEEIINFEIEAEPIEKKYTRKNPLTATILTNQKITGRNSQKNIRHIEIDLDGSGLKYEPGDSLGVWFQNDPITIGLLLKNLKINPDTIIQINGEPYTISDALSEIYEITQLHPGFVEKYAKLTKDKKLISISSDKKILSEFVNNRQVIDVVHEYPYTITANDLISMLRKLTPRLYSIASSQTEFEDEVHLTVAVVEYDAFGLSHLGGASGHLYNLKENEFLKIYTQSSDHFKLPSNSDTPIIMIGPGTGIAPFRAFLQERYSTNAKGKNWLFFGNPHFTEDFLYQTELQNYLDNGFLEKIDLAFSRDQKEKIYVQHKMLENSNKFNNWIKNGAYVYVCGDESKMAKDVHEALIEILKKENNISFEESEKLLDQLRKDGRYLRDVY